MKISNMFKKKKEESVEETVENVETEVEAEQPEEQDDGRMPKKPELNVDMTITDDDDDIDEPEKKGLAKLFQKQKPKKEYTFEDNPHLLTLRPREQYLFFSDYIRIDDNTYTCILAMFHNTGALDRFGQFWGLNLLPHNLPKTTKVIRFEQVNRMTDEWVGDH